MIVMQYKLTIKCDNPTCDKYYVQTKTGTPPSTGIPINWIQAQPQGSRDSKEFCSPECFSSWSPPVMPWDDEAEDGEYEN